MQPALPRLFQWKTDLPSELSLPLNSPLPSSPSKSKVQISQCSSPFQVVKVEKDYVAFYPKDSSTLSYTRWKTNTRVLLEPVVYKFTNDMKDMGAGLNIRASPDADAQFLGSCQSNTVIVPVNKQGPWIQCYRPVDVDDATEGTDQELVWVLSEESTMVILEVVHDPEGMDDILAFVAEQAATAAAEAAAEIMEAEKAQDGSESNTHTDDQVAGSARKTYAEKGMPETKTEGATQEDSSDSLVTKVEGNESPESTESTESTESIKDTEDTEGTERKTATVVQNEEKTMHKNEIETKQGSNDTTSVQVPAAMEKPADGSQVKTTTAQGSAKDNNNVPPPTNKATDATQSKEATTTVHGDVPAAALETLETLTTATKEDETKTERTTTTMTTPVKETSLWGETEINTSVSPNDPWDERPISPMNDTLSYSKKISPEKDGNLGKSIFFVPAVFTVTTLPPREIVNVWIKFVTLLLFFPRPWKTHQPPLTSTHRRPVQVR